MVQPQNIAIAVDEILSLLKLDPDQLFMIEPSDPDGECSC